jgi:uncharacterized protein
MHNNPTAFYLMTAAVALIVGLSKGGMGGTLGALATPMMALVLPPNEVIGFVLPILMVADVFAIAMHWRRWDRRLILLLLPGGIVGITVGTFFITNAPTEVLRLVLGIIVLLFVLYKFIEKPLMKRITYTDRNWHGLIAGTLAGFSSSLAHIGSPPVSIYLLMQQVTPAIFIGTSALYFGILNWIKVPYYLYADQFNFAAIVRIVWLLPLIPFGVWIGKWGAGHVNRDQFEWIITATLAIIAVMLLVVN